jgi:hypothetical protein
MSHERFNHLFLGLMGGGLLCAFVIPPSITMRAQGKVDGLLWPVVKPVRAIAEGFHSKFGRNGLPPGETRVRGDSELAIENGKLRQHVAYLNQQLEELRNVEAERRRMGDLLEYCTPVSVMGGDSSSTRESISLAPLSGVSLQADLPVLSPEGLVGKIAEGGRVRLITDRNYTIIAQFGRFIDGTWTIIPTPRASVVGMGAGQMQVTNLTVVESKELRPGDWVVIHDADAFGRPFSSILQGRKIGQIDSIRPLPSKPLFAEVIVRRKENLRTRKEVMVMTGKKR